MANQGQSKMHDVELRSETGEVLATGQVSQENWRTHGKVLRGAGWARTDGDEEGTDAEVARVVDNIVWGT